MAFILILLQVWNSAGLHHPAVTITGAGGPDLYGYRWIDSDTIGGPAYNWIDIKGIGTKITGLADDNVVGPFPIGFNFPYYWYTVNSFYVGSNGYIAFGDNYLEAHPFQALPNTARPNNILAALMADLDFIPQGSCWYWTNTAQDTCIIQYDSVRFWNVPGSLNTFQIILSRADSAIAFQYRTQNGTAPGPPGALSVGIENISGTIGLRYLFDNTPPYNALHSNLAIRFYPPVSTTYEVHDIGVWKVMSDNSGGFFVYNGETVNLWALVKNAGNQTESGFRVFCQIRNIANVIVFADTITVGTLEPGQTDSLLFTPGWTPTINGLYSLKVKSLLAGDMTPTNDSIMVEIRVVTYPTQLLYDGGVAGIGLAWGGENSGFGNYFKPPKYPVRVTQLSFHVTQTSGTAPVNLQLIDDDGPHGGPGTVLFDTLLTVATAGMINVDLTNYTLVIGDGGFYVGVIAEHASDPYISMDTLPLFSMQGWEYTGSWAPHRDNARYDIMIRASIELWTAVEENLTFSSRSRKEYFAAPNPFTKSTTIAVSPLLNEMKIYDIAGRLVRNLKVENGAIEWDGCDDNGVKVNKGIYFGIANGKEKIKLIRVR